MFYYLSKFAMTKEEVEKEEKDIFVKTLKQKVKKLNQDKAFASFLTREEDAEFQMNTIRNEGKEEGKIEVVKKMLQEKLPIELTSRVSGLSIEEIESLR